MSLLIGIVGACIGAAATIFAKRYFDADYLRYLEERRRAECEHEVVTSLAATPFCEKCQKIFTDDELALWNVRRCQHRRLDLVSEDQDTMDLLCLVCTAEFTVNKVRTNK